MAKLIQHLFVTVPSCFSVFSKVSLVQTFIMLYLNWPTTKWAVAVPLKPGDDALSVVQVVAAQLANKFSQYEIIQAH